jgi:hypothetical protein
LQGNYPNPTVHRVHGVDFQSGAPAVDDTWIYVSTPFGTQPFQWQHSKLKTSQVQNDSTVTGTNADDALEHLDSTKVPTTRTLTINGTTQDLSANRTFSVGTFNLPALTSGSVLFSNGTTIAQDNANFFWDNINKRLGIGTTTPSTSLSIFGVNELLQIGDGTAANFSFISFNGARAQVGYKTTGLHLLTSSGRSLVFGSGSFASTTEWGRFVATTGNFLINTTTDSGYKLDVNGTAMFRGVVYGIGTTGNIIPVVSTNGQGTVVVGGTSPITPNVAIVGGSIDFQINGASRMRLFNTGNFTLQNGGTFTDAGYRLDVQGTGRFTGSAVFSSAITVGGASAFTGSMVIGNNNITEASAKLEVRATTQGFLPPRMTTTQKNAIASPAAGLVVYDTTLNKLCVRTASSWETITSI